ncbi:carbohydrate ABC transporter membrane protein 2 (CUT1 family) [Mobilisporobacter senegalensis]|uniref:Carbohydrate ABC transporter membrane protein 2 (CUT1 family) n=1 Tax=Mobilisporobacter senegalensis TaxID=1329262 RepID=A0A3N1XRJ5_9FIRM|nr:carbohydrate ABC transporter permease [Mobilisporobacter senegalensis]ROR27427.1 carbohydrate ABC transporter membrane protein 2 (CUT1 family) [Mobilisporobacter senegalensis]
MDFVGKNTRSKKIGRIFLIGFMIIVAIGQLFPLIWLFDFSLAKSGDLFASDLLIIPDPPQWVNYVTAFVDGKVLKYLFNSIIVNVITVVATVMISLLVAFACTRMKWKLSKMTMGILLLGMMIPIHATLLPNFILYSKMNLTDSIFALLIPYIAFALPQGIFIMSSFLEGIPKALEEAAVMDGCGIYRIIFQIIFPMMKPAMITISIMTFLNSWNEFTMAMTYLESDKYRTLPFSVLNFAGQYASNYAVQFAVMVLTALPALVVFILLNEQITKGITVGAVKG